MRVWRNSRRVDLGSSTFGVQVQLLSPAPFTLINLVRFLKVLSFFIFREKIPLHIKKTSYLITGFFNGYFHRMLLIKL